MSEFLGFIRIVFMSMRSFSDPCWIYDDWDFVAEQGYVQAAEKLACHMPYTRKAIYQKSIVSSQAMLKKC